MLVPILVTAAVVLGVVAWYITWYAPKRNPLFRAEEMLRQNQVEEAILEYRKALEKNPEDYLLHYKLAQLYYKLERIDQGVLHLEEVMRIGMFNYEVEKLEVERKLARAYLERDELERAFQMYLNILADYPADEEALYHVSFISLGQELFDMAQKHFEKLLRQQEKKSFEVLFGAGMAHYMNRSAADAVTAFQKALEERPDSEIALISLAFALKEKHDYKNAIMHTQRLVDSIEDPGIQFVVKRLLAILLAQQKKWKDALKLLQQLLDFTQQKDMIDEKAIVLYDLGFVALKSDKMDMAYDYWNQLYQIQRSYKNVKDLVMLLRQEMDMIENQKKDLMEETAIDHLGAWLQDIFPYDLIWRICGLRSKEAIDMNNIVITARVGGTRPVYTGAGTQTEQDTGDRIKEFEELDIENFKIISNRMLEKLGFRVKEIMDTYRESDGADFMAINSATGNMALVWVRRWKKTRVGEIPLRNFAQEINDQKLKEGLFVTTTPLTQSGDAALKRLSKVNVVLPEEVERALAGLL